MNDGGGEQQGQQRNGPREYWCKSYPVLPGTLGRMRAHVKDDRRAWGWERQGPAYLVLDGAELGSAGSAHNVTCVYDEQEVAG